MKGGRQEESIKEKKKGWGRREEGEIGEGKENSN